MRGRIWVESPSERAYGSGDGLGSTFHFIVWIGRIEGDDRAQDQPKADLIDYKQVLLLFKNQMRVRMLKKWLEEQGFLTRVAMNIQEAWSWMMDADAALLETDQFNWLGTLAERDDQFNPNRLHKESFIDIYTEEETEEIPICLSHLVRVIPRKPNSKAELMAHLTRGSDPLVYMRHRQTAITYAENMADTHQSSILVVEDNPLNQKLINRILEKKGYWVEIAENGLKALDAVRRRPYDLILMDIQMPELDGVSATKILRQEGFSMPIIALTAHALQGDRESYLRAGMDNYLGKPVRQEELSQLLDKYLAGKGA